MNGKYGGVPVKLAGLAGALILLMISFGLSIRYGFVTMTWEEVLDSFARYDGENNQHIIILTARLPRALIAASVGASLALAGAVMQALTRNALASPGLLGVNAGASLAVVSAIAIFSVREMESLMWVAFIGAAFAALTVYAIAALGRDGLTPIRMILAGAAMTAFFSSLTQGVLVRNNSSLQEVLFWLAGSVAGRPMEMMLKVFPYLCGGWILTLLLSRQLNILRMGEDAAKGLGQRIGFVKALSGLVVVVLAGGSVAIAGPIGLIGIMVPHMARTIAGTDYRWLIPYCALLGASLLLLADVAARFVWFPSEVPVGILTAAIGAPFFLSMARKELRSV